MLEIGAAVGEVGESQEGGLGGDPAESIGDRELRVTVGGSGYRRDDSRQRRRPAEEDPAEQRPAHAGADGELIGDRREAHARAENDESGGREEQNGRDEGKIGDHRRYRTGVVPDSTGAERPMPPQLRTMTLQKALEIQMAREREL